MPMCIFLTAFGYFPLWIVYKVVGESGEVGVFTSKTTFIGVILRGLASAVIVGGIAFSLFFGMLGGVNMGVIASVLTTAMFFTALIFYLVYGEKLSLSDWIGAFLIVIGVALISLFTKNENNAISVDSSNSTKAVVCALVVAITIGL